MASVKKISSKKIGAKKSEVSLNKDTAEIEKLAYKFYIEGGCKEGNHRNDWLRAEAMVCKKSLKKV